MKSVGKYGGFQQHVTHLHSAWWGPRTAMFIGEYLHKMDSKRRVVIPAKFRKRSVQGNTVVITPGSDTFLKVYPLEAWEARNSKTGRLPSRQPEIQCFIVQLDRSGRIQIPAHLSVLTHFGANVIICGVYDHLEIWDACRWEALKKSSDEQKAW